ncbi:MAG: GntR family transcriptional regulator [Bifidobacteriaceae bacterium]|jgi:DNA-binding transcriptional regulator YhcF (GntR family)|nr:GntR family transcriptional regulator [Bifidobacteriaceae bacterium]
MILSVDPDSDLPVGAQLRDQIGLLIRSGSLADGARLPAIRHLAADLGLARGTVAKVYEQLARDGLIRSSGRQGTVVAPNRGGSLPRGEAATRLHDAAWRLAVLARQLGLGESAAAAALVAAQRELDRLDAPGTDSGRAPDGQADHSSGLVAAEHQPKPPGAR